MSRLSETRGVLFELLRHFLARMFEGEWSSGGGHWQRIAVSAFALLLPAGLLLIREGSLDPNQTARGRLAAALQTAGGCDAFALADQLALLTLLFAIAGLLGLLQWQSLFPSKRDYLSLAGYPVRSRQLFLARFCAVSIFSVGLVAAVTLLPSLIASFEFAGPCETGGRYAAHFAAEAAACGLGCLFVLLAMVALQGVLLNVLPGRWFVPAATAAQGGLIGLFLLAAFYSFSIQGWSGETMAIAERIAAWAPPVWFAGLHHTMLGSRDPFLNAMAERALRAALAAAAVVVASYAISYGRYRRLLIEAPAHGGWLSARHWRLSRLLARDPRRAAVFDFMATTLARSGPQRAIWLAYLGGTAAILLNSSLLNGRAFHHWTGWRNALQFVVLFWPLAATVTVLNGFRHALSVPAELRANWIFRIAENQGRREWMAAVERFILAYTVAPIYLVSAPLAVYALGWPMALRMTGLQLLFSLAVFELLFNGWQRLPFTCSYVPGKRSLVAVLASYVAVLCALVPVVAIHISTASKFVPLYYFYLPVYTMAWLWLRRRRRDGWGEAILEYEDLWDTMPNLGIGEMTYGGAEAGRTDAGNVGHADSEDADSGADARLRSCGVHSADLRGCAAGGGGSALPGAAPPGAARAGDFGVGRLGEQSPGEVLPAYGVRAQAPGVRDDALETGLQRNRPHFGARLAEGEFGELTARVYLKLRALFARRRLERDLDDELAFHLAMRQEQAGDAPLAARRRFGNVTRIREQCWDLWTFRPVETFLNDLRYGVRQLRRSPGFTISAAATLALGIGATTAVYSLLAAILWRPVPLPDLKSLVFVYMAAPGRGAPTFAPAGDLEEIRREAETIENLSCWTLGRHNVVDAGGEAIAVESARVSPGLFTMLRVQPALGRAFLPDEDQPGRERVAILGHDLWQRRFGGDPGIIGRSIRVNSTDFMVVGVMPPEFRFPRSWRELWVPLVLAPETRASHDGSALEAAGRLRPGRTMAQAASELKAIAVRLEERYPETNRRRRFVPVPLERYWYGDLAPVFAALLLGASVFVLLIACFNVANLQFSRAAGRFREVAVRMALGSGRTRLIRQLLTENLVLATFGAGLGLLVARWALGLFKAGIPAEMRHYMPGWAEIGLNGRALRFTLAVTVASAIVAGLAPALRSLRVDLTESLKEGGHGSSAGRMHGFWRNTLVAGQIAAATVLLVGSVLMVRGFRALTTGGVSLRPSAVLTLRLSLSPARYRNNQQVIDFYADLLERASAIPGVESAVAATGLPYSRRYPSGQFSIEGREKQPGEEPGAILEAVTPDYFKSLSVGLRSGRLLSAADGPMAQPVALISASTAKRWWKGADPVGQRIRIGERGPIMIVGVVQDIPYTAMSREASPTIYVPFAQAPDREMDIGLRTAGDPLHAAAAVRTVIRGMDPELPITNLNTMETLVQQESFGLAMMAGLMGGSGLLALVLSAVGVYGVMAYSISGRTHEIGIRMALGARRTQVIAVLFRSGIRSTLVGLGLGLIPAWGVARLMQGTIWGISAADAAAFLGVPAILMAAAALAIGIPAMRATRVDPMRALRNE